MTWPLASPAASGLKNSATHTLARSDNIGSGVATGISLDDYAAILRAQGNRCAGCGKRPRRGRNLHVDHDHDSGEVRGLLCVTCNVDLAVFEDAAVAEWAPGYLSEPPARIVLRTRSEITPRE